VWAEIRAVKDGHLTPPTFEKLGKVPKNCAKRKKKNFIDDMGIVETGSVSSARIR
jgi:hypothetical protein